MGFSLEAAGAGASSGLDDFLQRMLLEQQVNQKGQAQQEDVRHNQATEALQGRQIGVAEGDKAAAEAERQAKTAAMTQAGADETVRKQREDQLLNDPTTDPVIKKFIQLRRITPKGETVPFEPIGKVEKTPVDPLEHVNVGGSDVLTPRSQAAGKAGFHVPPTPATQFIQTDNGLALGDKRTGTTTPVTDKKTGSVVQPQLPANMRMADMNSSRVNDSLDRMDSLLKEADKRGLTGPAAGRAADFMAGKVGTTGNADDDQLLGALKLDMQSVPPQIALALGEGARGASSVQMIANWKQLFNLHGSDFVRGAMSETRKMLPRSAKKSGGTDTPPATSGGAVLTYNPATGRAE